MAEKNRHCDEYIDDPEAPPVLRKYLDFARSPAHGLNQPKPHPALYATYAGQAWNGVNPGDRVRVVMASRMGDVGITKNFKADHGYLVRCYVAQLTEFGDAP